MKATNLIKKQEDWIFFNDIFELQHAFRNSSYSYLSIINWQYEQKPIYYYIQHLYSSFQQSLLFKSIPYWFLIKNSFLCMEQKVIFGAEKSSYITTSFRACWLKHSKLNERRNPRKTTNSCRIGQVRRFVCIQWHHAQKHGGRNWQHSRLGHLPQFYRGRALCVAA